MKDFRKATQNATVISRLLENRTKITTDDVIAKYPDGITIVGFDIIDGVDKKGNATQYPAFIFTENDSECFFGGCVLMNIAKEWLTGYPDTETASAELKDFGGVKIKLEKGLTRDGNNVTKVTVL